MTRINAVNRALYESQVDEEQHRGDALDEDEMALVDHIFEQYHLLLGLIERGE
jgi:hypothetical protein